MTDMMKWDPKQRPTASQVLQYPYFQVSAKVPSALPVANSSSSRSPNKAQQQQQQQEQELAKRKRRQKPPSSFVQQPPPPEQPPQQSSWAGASGAGGSSSSLSAGYGDALSSSTGVGQNHSFGTAAAPSAHGGFSSGQGAASGSFGQGLGSARQPLGAIGGMSGGASGDFSAGVSLSASNKTLKPIQPAPGGAARRNAALAAGAQVVDGYRRQGGGASTFAKAGNFAMGSSARADPSDSKNGASGMFAGTGKHYFEQARYAPQGGSSASLGANMGGGTDREYFAFSAPSCPFRPFHGPCHLTLA